MSNEWLTTGQMIDQLKEGQIAEGKAPFDGYVRRIKKREDGVIVNLKNNGDYKEAFKSELTILNRSMLDSKWRILPSFKVGDWVKHKSYSKPEKIVKQNDDSIETETLIDNIKAFKQATTEEIKQEKERRWWMKIGREINEYKNGDIVSTGSITRKINYLFENGELGLEGMDYGYKPNELILVCPTENRLDTQ